MDIQAIGTVQATSASVSVETLQYASVSQTKTAAVDTEPAAVYSKSEKIDTGAYTNKGKRAQAVAEALKAAEEQRIATLTNTISMLFQKQSVFGAKAKSKVEFSYEFLSKLNVDVMTADQASAAIADDGEWGVNAVATRIMDMAIALSGGDTEKASMLKSAMLKGFDQAGAAFGSKLPDITQRTKDELLTRFDYWEKNGSMDGYQMGANATEA
ncbi:MAG: hypothetical protein PHC80_01540 [Eubacteriales bacterium]|nr:hypothetical protein [Eubacteriales bacterium]